MNLKHFTRTTLLLFFCLSTTAQVTNAIAENVADLTFSILDDVQNIRYELTPNSQSYTMNHGLPIAFRIDINYEAEIDFAGYFGIQYIIYKIAPNGFDTIIIRGVTVPVLIPPARKNKSRDTFKAIEEYPFKIFEETILGEANYEIKMNLVKYDSQEDYNRNNYNFQTFPSFGFIINTISDEPVARNGNTFSVYPNPSAHQLIFEFPTIIETSKKAKLLPIEVALFDDNGNELSQHELKATLHNNKAQYVLDIKQLQKGRYFYQLKRGGKTYTKPFLKN
ncbi:putative secreted protein (Por secretion system target) [Kordia periserrulae]|uniref:Putative secreted protein (Por secretion system target) n=1 Tax=Kordia periserrulae TaxID=701523 RepID=A0A2T6BVT7_9FLAO|nr:T9SS type A sorting domain-containing protein [Kordia periserrulae]PTX60198.1 putative secreted protein (Por secretion system target) [Kordia periserrulae]